MIRPLLAVVAIGFAQAAAAQSPPGGFRPLRYDEDWRDTCAGSGAAPIGRPYKCISIARDLSVAIGGELRERIELFDDPLFGLNQQSDRVFMHRALLHSDVRIGAAVRIFAQLGFEESSGRRGPVPRTDVNRLDLAQAFVDLSLPVAGGDLTLRPGRQEIAFGSSRIISVRGGPNVRQSFDGARAFWRSGDVRIDALYVRPVTTEPGTFDDPTSDTVTLWGLHSTGPLAGRAKLDLYYLGYRNDRARFANAAGREERHSFGVRLFGAADGWDWNSEALYQVGTLGTQRIRAWTMASDTGYTFAAPLKPRLGLKANVASGDAGASDGRLGTFNALFPRFPYFSEAVLYAPANFYDVHPSLAIQPAKGLTVSVEYDRLWRHRLTDAVYLAPLVPVAGTAGRPGRWTGDQMIVGALWRASPALQFEAQYVHFRAGNVLRRVGGDNGDFLMAAATFQF